MINFIVNLEDMLKVNGIEDWEIIYVPNYSGYLLKLNGEAIFMVDVNEIEKEIMRNDQD